MPINNTNLIYRALTQQLPNFIGPKYRQLSFASGVVHPILLDLQAGVEDIREAVITEYGDADFIGDAMDFPIVSVGQSEDTYPVFMIGSAYGFSWKSSRSLQFANRLNELARRKTAVAARAIEQKCHKFLAIGSPRVGQTGFLNNPLVTPRTASGFNPTDANLTAKRYRSFLMDLIWNVYIDQLQYTMMPTRILLSPKLYKLGTDLLMPDSSLSVLSSVRESISTGMVGNDERPLIDIVQAPECSAAYLEANGVMPVGTGVDRVVIYPYDSEVVSAHMEPLGVVPPDWMGSERGRKVFANFKCLTPSIWSQPIYAQYMDVPAAA